MSSESENNISRKSSIHFPRFRVNFVIQKAVIYGCEGKNVRISGITSISSIALLHVHLSSSGHDSGWSASPPRETSSCSMIERLKRLAPACAVMFEARSE